MVPIYASGAVYLHAGTVPALLHVQLIREIKYIKYCLNMKLQ